MKKAPRLIYLLRKSKQAEDAAIPVLRKTDFPLRFYFKGHEVTIAVTQNNNLEVNKTRLAGANVD